MLFFYLLYHAAVPSNLPYIPLGNVWDDALEACAEP